MSMVLHGPLKSHVQAMRAANMDMLVPAHLHAEPRGDTAARTLMLFPGLRP